MSGYEDYRAGAAGVSGLAPNGLRELLGLLAELTRLLPSATDMPGWERRRQVERDRHALLGSRLELLNDQLAIEDTYPSVAAEMLADFCERSAEVIRAELAKPLGYEPRAAAAEQPA